MGSLNTGLAQSHGGLSLYLASTVQNPPFPFMVSVTSTSPYLYLGCVRIYFLNQEPLHFSDHLVLLCGHVAR